jgi:hypothetical protein
LWLKRATTTPPPAQPCEGKGEDLLNKNVSYTLIIIKSILKMTFLVKTSETKTFVKFFCEAFLIFKKYFASTIQDLFSFLQKRLFKFPCSED